MIDGTGNSDIADTNDSWFCMQDKAYSPLSVNWGGYIAVCPGEIVDMHKHFAEWEDENCDSTQWQHAEMIVIPVYKNKGSIVGEAPAWQLVPSALPQMELSKQRIARVRLFEYEIAKEFPSRKTNVTIPANTNARLLLDNNVGDKRIPYFSFQPWKRRYHIREIPRVSVQHAQFQRKPQRCGWQIYCRTQRQHHL